MHIKQNGIFVLGMLILLVSYTKKSTAEQPENNKTLVDSGGIKIYAPVAQYMLIDEKNPVRFSPLNMFDGDSETVYKVRSEEVDMNEYLLDILFAEPAVFDTLTIRAGNFHKKEYKESNRLKNLSIELLNCLNKDYDQEIELQDKCIEQILYEGEEIVVTELRIKVNTVYRGRHDDITISDLLFYLNGEQQSVSFDKGKCIFGEDFSWYEYDEQGRLIKSEYQAGHAGGGMTLYKYENGKIFAMSKSWEEDDNAENEYVEIESTEDSPKDVKIYYKDGKKSVEMYSHKEHNFLRNYDYDSYYINQYLYDETGRVRCLIRICENENWSNKFTEFSYNEKNQLVKQVGYEDATIYTDRYIGK